MPTLPRTEQERQLRGAEARSRRSRDPRAVGAVYDASTRRVIVELSNGCTFAFPSAIAEGLGDATSAQLAQVEISSAGLALHWEELDVDLTVAGLLRGVFGTQRWMSELGRMGGRARSEAKARAARENGKKGGRPRKPRPEV